MITRITNDSGKLMKPYYVIYNNDNDNEPKFVVAVKDIAIAFCENHPEYYWREELYEIEQ